MRISKRLGKVMCTALAATLALAMCPTSALALGSITKWTVPSGKTSTTVTKDGKTYSYITAGCHRITEAAVDMLGICNVTVDASKGNPFTYTGTAAEIYESVSSSARIGVFGSDVNTNVNPYYANYFYNVYQDSIGSSNKADAKDTILIQTGNLAPTMADTIVSTEYGTSPTLYKRPDMLYGVLAKGSSSITDTTTGAEKLYGTSLTTTSGYSQLVSKIQNKQLGTDSDGNDLYQAGDENYDPYYVNYLMNDGSTYYNIENMYNLAAAADEIIEKTANTSNPKTTRYNDPEEIAEDYEAYLLGLQYAVQSAIDSKQTTKKTVGVISKMDQETMTFEFGTFDKGTTSYTSNNRACEALENVCDNVVDVRSLANNTGTAADVMACDAIYIFDSSTNHDNKNAASLNEDILYQMLKAAGYTDESKYPDILSCSPKPVLQIGAYSPENAQNFAFMIGFAYPEVVNPVHAMAYFYEEFYHVKTSRLADALGLNLASMSLPTGVDLNIENYSNAKFEKIINNGLVYYSQNKAAVDSAYPKLEATDTLMNGRVADAVEAAKANTISAKNVTKSFKAAKTGKLAANKTFKLSASAATKVAYKKTSGTAKIAVSNAGAVTVKKGLAKGTYKVKVKLTAKADANHYAAAAKTITVTVKIK